MYTCIGIVKASLKLLLLVFFLISDEKKNPVLTWIDKWPVD